MLIAFLILCGIVLFFQQTLKVDKRQMLLSVGNCLAFCSEQSSGDIPVWIKYKQRFRMCIAVWRVSIRAHWHHLGLLMCGNGNFIRITICMPVSQMVYMQFIRNCLSACCIYATLFGKNSGKSELYSGNMRVPRNHWILIMVDIVGRPQRKTLRL